MRLKEAAKERLRNKFGGNKMQVSLIRREDSAEDMRQDVIGISCMACFAPLTGYWLRSQL